MQNFILEKMILRIFIEMYDSINHNKSSPNATHLPRNNHNPILTTRIKHPN